MVIKILKAEMQKDKHKNKQKKKITEILYLLKIFLQFFIKQQYKKKEIYQLEFF